MRRRNIILLAAVLSLAALLVAAGPALAGNATAVSSPGHNLQDTAPIKAWPRPLAEMPAASSPAVYMPTATPRATPTALPTPTMKTDGAVMTGDVATGDQTANRVLDQPAGQSQSRRLYLAGDSRSNGQQADTFTLPVTVS